MSEPFTKESDSVPDYWVAYVASDWIIQVSPHVGAVLKAAMFDAIYNPKATAVLDIMDIFGCSIRILVSQIVFVSTSTRAQRDAYERYGQLKNEERNAIADQGWS